MTARMMGKSGITVPGRPGTWTEVDRRSGFRLLESDDDRLSPRIVVNGDLRVVAETYGDLTDVLGSVMGPARAAHGFAVASRKPRNRGFLRRFIR